MIFRNPAGAPELACDECGCRWFDRMTNTCYECSAAVSEESLAEYHRALAGFQAQREAAGAAAPSGAGPALPKN
jgi:hypothetical protein